MASIDRHVTDVDISGEKQRRRGGWITAPFIFGCEAAERLAMSGSHANLITFLVQQMHQKTLNSAAILNTFASTSMLTPLLGAFVADAYIGRYTTIAFGSWIYLSGMLLLTMTALDKTLRPVPCTGAEANAGTCQAASSLQMGILYISFALMALGSGGIRPCVSPFGASQFDQTHPEEKKQLKHYFNWYYFSVSIAGLLAITTISYIQDNVGWGLGFGLPSIVMLLSIVFFLAGTRLYRYSPPRGSPFTRMTQVLVAAFRKRKLEAPDDPSKLYTGGTRENSRAGEVEKKIKGLKTPSNSHNDSEGVKQSNHADDSNPANLQDGENDVGDENMGKKEEMVMAVGPRGGPGEEQEGNLIVQRHSNQFRCLDKAAIQVEGDVNCVIGQGGEILKRVIKPWRLCTVQQVEELKCVVRMAPMWATVIPTALVISQQYTYTVQQARSMDRQFGSFVVPPASLSSISIITLLIWLPFYDKKVAPFLRRSERQITFLHKIGVGFILLLLTLVITTLVEHKRRAAAWHFGFVDKPNDMIPISAMWLAPQFIIGGLSESFMMIGNMEFFYYMVPEHMTSTGSALFMTSIAVGSNLSSIVLHVVQSITNKAGQPGWLDNNLNKAHLDYFYGFLTLVLSLDFIFYLLVARWYKTQRNFMKIMVESG